MDPRHGVGRPLPSCPPGALAEEALAEAVAADALGAAGGWPVG